MTANETKVTGSTAATVERKKLTAHEIFVRAVKGDKRADKQMLKIPDSELAFMTFELLGALKVVYNSDLLLKDTVFFRK